MLEYVADEPKMKREEYHDRYDELATRLMVLQQMAKFADLGIVVLFEGWDSSGKGSRISDLVVNLDSRLFNVFATQDPEGNEKRLPFMARFWSRIGGHGTMTIFDQGWYSAVAKDLVVATERDSSEKKLTAHADRAIQYSLSIRSFETQLANDGYLIVKFFLHISEAEQRERFMRLMLNPNTSWRITDGDISQVQHYKAYYRVFDRLLEATDRSSAHWTVVDASHSRNANITIMETLVKQMENALSARGVDVNGAIEDAAKARSSTSHEQVSADGGIGSAADISSVHELVKVGRIEDARHDLVLSEAEYKQRLKAAQAHLRELQTVLYRRRIPMIVAYEGWDAAGKGGNIKRVSSALDARSYAVHPISAPSPNELAHPFLWRFWTKLPRTGHIAIFDRTWYGRVLVERVEGYASPDQWRRAYDEINEFEEELERWGAILVKFWINVSEDEQLRRFEDRQNTPARRWKITPDDWRNREKNDLYRTCIDDMLRLTSTPYAPWRVIESDDKHFARVKTLETINDAIERKIRERDSE